MTALSFEENEVSRANERGLSGRITLTWKELNVSLGSVLAVVCHKIYWAAVLVPSCSEALLLFKSSHPTPTHDNDCRLEAVARLCDGEDKTFLSP